MSASFIDLAPKGRVNYVEEALDALKEHSPVEHQSALRVLESNQYTSTQIAEVFQDMGFEEVTSSRVRHHRRKMKEKKS